MFNALLTALVMVPLGTVPVGFAIALDWALGGKEAGYLIPQGEHRVFAAVLIALALAATLVVAIATDWTMTP